jgi:hypothetical protein
MPAVSKPPCRKRIKTVSKFPENRRMPSSLDIISPCLSYLRLLAGPQINAVLNDCCRAVWGGAKSRAAGDK